MARRRQSNSDSGLELGVKLGLCFIVLIIAAVGPARWNALPALAVTLFWGLLGLGLLALLGWLLFRMLLPFLERESEPVLRTLPFPEEASAFPPLPAPTAAPIDPEPQARQPQWEPSPPPWADALEATETQAGPRMRAGDLTEQFRSLDWFQFEKIVALIYRKLGDDVERRGGANADGGIDLLLRRNGKVIGVQCKHWRTWKVGVKAVREFLGALTAAGLQDGIFVSLGDFSPEAARLASRQGIQLVDARDLGELVRRAGLCSDLEFLDAVSDPRKYCPKCERELVRRTATKGTNAGLQFWGCSTYPRCNYILRT